MTLLRSVTSTLDFDSFADLYERAVRNVLSIRPLFDSPLDIFAQNPDEASLRQMQVQQQPLHTTTSKGYQQQSDNAEQGGLHRRHQRKQESTDTQQDMRDSQQGTRDKEEGVQEIQPAHSDYFAHGVDQSPNRFFAQVLSEHVRQSQSRSYLTQRPMLHANQSQKVDQITNSLSSRIPAEKEGTFQQNRRFSEARGEEYRRYWSNYPERNHRHKHGMLDSLKHTLRPSHASQLQSNLIDNAVQQKFNTMHTEDLDELKKKTTNIDDNSIPHAIEYTHITKTDLDSLKEKLKENARLTYRPYSLRSKKSGVRKTFAGSKKKKHKSIKRPKVKITWKPTSPQEIFLSTLGLMRKKANITRTTNLTEERKQEA